MKYLIEETATEPTKVQARPIMLGRLLVTPGVIDQVSQVDLLNALVRHRKCDWGNVCPEDKAENDRAAKHGGRIFSVFDTQDDIRFWIITEADRRVTTALLPREY